MNTELGARTWSDLRGHWREPLALHLVLQLVGFALFTPLVTWVGRRIVLASGEPVISNIDIAAFVLSPSGAVFVLAIAALTIGLLFAELAGLSWIAGHRIVRRPVTTVATLAFVLRKLPRLIALSTRVFVRLVLLALPFLAAAGVVWFTLLAGQDINYYLAEHPPEWRRALLLATLLGISLALLVAWQLARWLFAVPGLVFAGVRPGQALADSARMTRGRLRQIVVPLLLWWLSITAVAIVLVLVCRQISDAGLDWAGLDIRRVLPLVAVYVVTTLVGGFLYGGVHLAGHQFLVTRLYAEQLDPARFATLAVPDVGDEPARRIVRPAIAVTLFLLALALGGAWLAASRLDLEREVAITAHRGASTAAPENTLAAFRAALDAGATYVELDVQRSRDGAIVVVHDGDLMRLGGDPRKVVELTLSELAGIDVGRKYAAAFAGETVPRLEDVIALVRGRMKINVELKYNVPDPGLAAAVLDLLQRENFLDQVVITSLDYAALREVERLEPSMTTGHIVTAVVGDVVRTEADFLSLNSARATASLIRHAHAAGKDIHVWTVNTPEAMVRMIERGVDNIITDDPALLARVMAERRTRSRAELLGLRLRVLFATAPPELTDPAAVQPL